MSKTLHNSDISGAKQNVSDLVTFGNGDTFKLLCKASSKSEGWMKSTKAMEILGVGCVVQVTTQQGNQIAEALTFVPGVKIHTAEHYIKGGELKLFGRKLVPLTYTANTGSIDTCENGCCVPTPDNPFGECENFKLVKHE